MLASNSEPSAPYHDSFLAFFPSLQEGQTNHRQSLDRFHGSYRFPSHAFVITCQSSVMSFMKKIYLLPQHLYSSPFESIIFSVRRSCAEEPYSVLDVRTLVLSWRCMVRTVFQNNVRHMDVAARGSRTALHCRHDPSANGTREVSQVYVADVEL